MAGQANLYGQLYGAASDAPAVLQPNGQTLSYAQMDAAAGRLAGALTRVGVTAGDRVSVVMDKCVEGLLLLHAALRIGAIVQPLNSQYTANELSSFLTDAAPVLVVASPAHAAKVKPLAEARQARLETLAPTMDGSLLQQCDDTAPSVAQVGEDHVAVLLYTSGTTGAPKGAQITHGNLASSARALAEVWALTSDDRLLHALPLTHAHGLLTAVNSMMAAGASIELLPRFDADEVVAALPRTTVFMGVPTFYSRLLGHADFPQNSKPIRLFVSGSAPLGAKLSDAMIEATGQAVRERYGATETAIVAAVPADSAARPGWVGWPLPGVEVRVRPSEEEPPQTHGLGQLETRGHNVFAGYWGRPEANEAAFTADGWFKTGDVAEIDDSGCLRIVGRTKDIVITGGMNVHPGEVEAVLEQLSAIEHAAVFGVPHDDFGEAVVAVAETSQPIEEQAAIEHVRSQLAGYKTPKRVLAVDAIPRDRMGKIRKASLREAYADLFQPSTGTA